MGKQADHEGPIHRSIVQYLWASLPGAIVHHSPNEGVRGGARGRLDGAKRKAMGVLAGYPDLVIHWRGQTILFEVKAERGTLTKSQREIRDKFRDQGIPYFIVRSIDDARESIREIEQGMGFKNG